jgi:hypothetical protein
MRSYNKAGIGLDVPAIVEAGKTVPVDVISQDGNPTLALHVVCHGDELHLA